MVRDPAAADGLLADAISRAIEFVERDQPRNFLAWLWAIARNMCRHWIRDSKRLEPMPDVEFMGHSRSGVDEVLTSEAMKIFEEEARHLTKNQRRALFYRVVDLLDYAEIAHRMRINEGAARALVFRAKSRLRLWRRYMRPGDDASA